MSVVGLCAPVERDGERALQLKARGIYIFAVFLHLWYASTLHVYEDVVNSSVNTHSDIYLDLSTLPALCTYTEWPLDSLGLKAIFSAGPLCVDIKYFSRPELLR